MRVFVLCLLALAFVSCASALRLESLQQQLVPADGVTHTVTTQADGSIAVTATATTTVIIPASEAAAPAAVADESAGDAAIVVGGSPCALQRGTCQADSNRCSGRYVSNLCPGTAGNVRCCLPAGVAPARSVSCTRPIGASPARITLAASIVAIGTANTHAPGSPRGICPRGKAMTAATVRQLLVAAWTAFGATAAQASTNADRNLRQVHRESTYCPNVVQGIISGDPNNNNPAGGLFQFIPSTFSFWRVRGHDNRYNPLSNILAAVNAQVNADCISPSSHARILNGSAGWTPQNGRNPFA